MENVKVIIWGLGAMGGGIADMLLKKKGVDIVGVVDWEAKVASPCISSSRRLRVTVPT